MAASMGCSLDVDTALPAAPLDKTPAPTAGSMAIRLPFTSRNPRPPVLSVRRAVQLQTVEHAQTMMKIYRPAAVLHCSKTHPLQDP